MNYIFTTIYPKSKKYYYEFINSVNLQTDKNFKIFIILNGTLLNNIQKKKIKNNYITYKTNTTWQKARIEGLKKLLKMKPKNIIFADSDDIMHKNRVKLSIEKIKKNDFVVNNCYLFKRTISKSEIWLNRKEKKINLNQIKYKNFIGCSNTTIKGKAMETVVNQINENLVAFDWCIAKLLLLKKFKGVYLPKPLTYYRQYSENTSSLLRISKKKIKKDIKCKLEHFKYFEKFGFDYKKKILELEKKMLKIDDNKFFLNIKKKFKTKNQYWWATI